MKNTLFTLVTVLLVGAIEVYSSDGFWDHSKVHRFHLEISNAEWEAMKALDPNKGQPPVDSSKTPDGTKREVHRSRFPWATGAMTINGQRLNGIGVRYKGNASFNLMRGSLKRNMKIKLDWTNDDQSYKSVETLNLNAGGLDPSKLRDAFSYWLFQQAGVPAPRTTFAELSLTIPGRFEKETLGLFTIVEQVNKSFLNDRFGSKKGLLMKPEGIASVEFHGDDWRFYAPLYRPDDTPTAVQTRRVMDFAHLVNHGNEQEFRDSIASYLDVDGFLRFIAVNTLIVNLDTLLAMPQNYYLHLGRDTNKFVFFPWDLDISFAGWPLGGKPADQMNLSLVHPHSSDEHNLIDRLFAIEPVKMKYDKIIRELVDGLFSREQLMKKFDELEKTVRDARKRDKAAVKARNERGYPAPFGFQPPGIREFINKRSTSIERQLNGTETGYIFKHGRPGGRLGHLAKDNFGRGRLAMHIMIQADINENQWVTKEELHTMLGGWFDSMDREQAGKLNKASFIKSLPEAFFQNSRKPAGRIPEPYVAEGLFALADSDKDGIVTKKDLTTSLNRLLEKKDSDENAKLNQRSMMIGIRSLIRQ